MEVYLIKTKRLGLRVLKSEDLNYLEKVDKDPEVKEFFPEGTLNRQEIKDYMHECSINFKEKNLPCLAIFKLKDGDFVGEAYFGELETGEIKVGYLFHKKFWNKGFASETLKGLLGWAKKNIDSDYIIAYADKDNHASFHVMEKCGMKPYKEEFFLGMDCRFYRIKNN